MKVQRSFILILISAACRRSLSSTFPVLVAPSPAVFGAWLPCVDWQVLCKLHGVCDGNARVPRRSDPSRGDESGSAAPGGGGGSDAVLMVMLAIAGWGPGSSWSPIVPDVLGSSASVAGSGGSRPEVLL